METTCDAFLGGRLQVLQPKHGYRAGADPVFLAASVAAQPGETVLELGCGVGVALLCLKARVADIQVTGIDIQTDLIALAQQNFAENGHAAHLIAGDLQALPQSIRTESYDHVMMNPPFFNRKSGHPAIDPGRETGRGLTAELSTWLDTGLKRLKPGGCLHLVNRIDSLPVCLGHLAERMGDIHILPLAPRVGRPAKLFVLKGKKGGKSGVTLSAPFILHDGTRHEKDGDSYSQNAKQVLREAYAFPPMD
jgi:tRNA1(Val) A37 N6-methylase TrmN6